MGRVGVVCLLFRSGWAAPGPFFSRRGPRPRSAHHVGQPEERVALMTVLRQRPRGVAPLPRPRRHRKSDQGTRHPVWLEGPVLPFVLGDRSGLSPRHLRLQPVRRSPASARPAPARRAHHAALAPVFLCRGLQPHGRQAHAQTRRRHAPTPPLVARSPSTNERQRRQLCSCRARGPSRPSPTHPALNCMSHLSLFLALTPVIAFAGPASKSMPASPKADSASATTPCKIDEEAGRLWIAVNLPNVT